MRSNPTTILLFYGHKYHSWDIPIKHKFLPETEKSWDSSASEARVTGWMTRVKFLAGKITLLLISMLRMIVAPTFPFIHGGYIPS
jgi:hypothetical protein